MSLLLAQFIFVRVFLKIDFDGCFEGSLFKNAIKSDHKIKLYKLSNYFMILAKNYYVNLYT